VTSLHKLVPLFALALNLLLLGSAIAGDRRHRRHYTFAGVALALAIWNVGVFGLRSAADADSGLFWEYVVHLGIIPLPAVFYHYVVAFLELRRRRPILMSAYAMAGAFLLVSPTTLFIAGVASTWWGWAPRSGPLYAPFFLYFQTFLALGLWELVRAHRTLVASFRVNRTRLVIAGVVVSLAGGLVDFLRFILGWERLYPVGIPSNALFAMALGIAIVRYRLWDVGLVAKRVLLYALIALGLAPLTVGALFLVSAIGGTLVNPTMSTVVLVVVFAAALPFLRQAERAIEQIIFAREHGVRETLNALTRDLAAILEVDRLGHALTEGLVRGVPVLHATFYLRETGAGTSYTRLAQAVSPSLEVPPPGAGAIEPKLVHWLTLTGEPLTVEELAERALTDDSVAPIAMEFEAARTAVLVPLFLEGELAAVLAVGEKVSAQVFEPRELHQLETLMAQTAVALTNAQLYQHLQEQMQELRRTQQQLVQSAKLAAIGELAAGVAHELNNPLTVIVGYAEMLAAKAEPGSPLGDKLAKIESEAMRASKITRGLLDYARRREPKHEPVEINALVPRALELIHSKLRGRAVKVQTRLDQRAKAILGDADQLTQVLINLAGNAIDAMENGGTLTVATFNGEEAVDLFVSDTGTGMSPEQVSRIFEPFYTTKPEGKGTGLGLSVTLGILKSHGGSIAVDSEPGRGTTMRVRLPHSFVADATPAAAAVPAVVA
jgi:signal transduction histidine kinase